MAAIIAVIFVLVGSAVAAKESSQSVQLAPIPSGGKSLLEVLANGGSLPAGNEYEIIRRAPDGSLHVLNVDNEEGNENPALPPPGATVVLLEEKPGGGYEVRGVQSSAPVDQLQGLLENIQVGSLQLPESDKSSNRVFLPPMPTGVPSGPTTPLPYTPVAPTQDRPSSSQAPSPTSPPTRMIHSSGGGQSNEQEQPRDWRPAQADQGSVVTARPPPLRRVSARPRTEPSPATLPPPATTTFAPTTQETFLQQSPSQAPYRQRSGGRKASHRRPNDYYDDEEEAEETEIVPETSESLRTSLTEVLRREGYKEMARLVERAGLEDMLAKTGKGTHKSGPYTIFAPTDLAFKQLMDQLGGTKRAEAKFKENPRLLSGLMLHHVIPGTFKVNTLQDEMTGISLAGTQLRVNIYDSKEVAVNGARIQRPDIWVPGGGVAHALDRVLFPLPVGDILHTLLSDSRFSRFLKIIHVADLEDVLRGKRTYTLFAPTDKAFESLSVGELSKLEGDRSKARALVARHLVPGALFTSGIRAYQVKYTMQQGVTIKLQSEAGNLKINSSHVVTQNIPATNGVVHAIDTLI